MTKHAHKLAGAAAALLAVAANTFAEIKLNDKFAVSGYISGSVSDTITDNVEDSFMDVDAVKLAGTAAFEKVTGTVSLHTFSSHEPVVLDAYATYNLGGGGSVTVGKFLSYLGFEAFDYPNMLQISYANSIGGFIPAYHAGVRLDYSADGVSAGVAVLDSVYGPTYYKGDGELDNGAGLEGYVKFSKGDSAFFAGFAYDDGVGGGSANRYTFDFWGQTKAGKTTLAAEYCYSKFKSGGTDADGYFWLLLAMHPVTDKWTVTARISGGEDESLGLPAPSFFKTTLSPAVTITDNLALLFEYSHIKYDDFSAKKQDFVAAQVIFKF